MAKTFDLKYYPWKNNINYRLQPKKYQIGKGEQGVLICEPYKSEILPYWKFKTPKLALKSANKIYRLFLGYIRSGEFVGADMARKFLQMGFTRSRRYANYRSGKKYKANGTTFVKGSGDSSKIDSANLFYICWQRAERNKKYSAWKKAWKEIYG